MTNYLRAMYFLRSMNKRAFWNRERLNEYREKKLREVVRYAYENSRFYNKRLRYAGVKPDDIRTVDDLNRLTIVRKDELARNLEDVVSIQYDITDLKVSRTSGSTGKTLQIYMTQLENEFRKAKHLRANIVCGQRPWHRWVTITSPLHFAESTRLQRILRVYAVSPVSVFEDVATQVSKIEKLKPDILDGYSNSILVLAKEVEKRGLKTIKPRFLISGAELISKPSRKFIEDVFEAPLYDQYACVEFERMAWQCRQKDEYHIDADSLIMQFVDENGEEVAPGEEGEVVCTSLSNYSMPFIRYGLDDIGIPSDVAECPCGRTFPLMKVMEGRKTSLLTFPSGRVLAPFAFMLAVWTFKYYGCIDLFRVIQRRKDLLVFKLKTKDCSISEQVIGEELERHLAKSLNLTEEDSTVEVEFVDDIPLDKNGKFRIVVSELGPTE